MVEIACVKVRSDKNLAGDTTPGVRVLLQTARLPAVELARARGKRN
jgi:hypothetical protein